MLYPSLLVVSPSKHKWKEGDNRNQPHFAGKRKIEYFHFFARIHTYPLDSVSFFVTPRQVDKAKLTTKDFVASEVDFAQHASRVRSKLPPHLPPEAKSSIDSGMQSMLYCSFQEAHVPSTHVLFF